MSPPPRAHRSPRRRAPEAPTLTTRLREIEPEEVDAMTGAGAGAAHAVSGKDGGGAHKAAARSAALSASARFILNGGAGTLTRLGEAAGRDVGGDEELLRYCYPAGFHKARPSDVSWLCRQSVKSGSCHAFIEKERGMRREM